MAPKLKKTVDKNDPRTFGQLGAYEAIRTLAEQNGWTSGFGVAMAAAHFDPRMPATITVADVKAAEAEIVARGLAQKGQKAVDAKREASGGRERFPFKEDPDEAQEWWDKGRWKDLKFGAYMTFGGLRKRFAAEIARGETISKVQVDAYQAELEAKQEEYLKLLDEKSDPNVVGPLECGAPDGFHKGEQQFQPTVRYKPERQDDGTYRRKPHKGGDELILVGNFMVVDEEAVPYCHACRQAVWQMIGEAKDKLPALQEALAKAIGEEANRLKVEVEEAEELAETRINFYTAAGATRRIEAAKRNAEGHSAVLGQLKGASKRSYTGSQFGLGTRKLGRADWRTTRRGEAHSR